jgi:misacylated tRNA(Ala) deacylase
MPTELLYLTDAYLTEFDAAIVAIEDDRVVLDRTAFYPTGGGQPHDTGRLLWEGGAANVVEVRKDGEVWHRLEGGLPPGGRPSTVSSTGTAATPSCAPTRPCTCCAG